ncbi:site-specific integrase [Clostridium botulinum]|uniref:tyrosine-type recombinase/integrase n=1 Tax=Clostridium botulinum TaxID=1491 RepID=UPI0006A6AD70|nr:site-specific integrase [Clostridium botulinum]KAI3346585.1 site-specific integrase [Clostridium botulinum]KOM86598.1 integrase [Clostridium botulinum]KOR55761.1 integrase [Clostridium botulinum]MCS6111356.1 site-specific integrase [Clostridium botulinum]NFL42585.1 site-specific integrase [Clostridium botulinum]
MNKRANGDGFSGWVTKNNKKYWCISISIGYDTLTGKLKRKYIYGKTQKEAKAKLKTYKENFVNNSDDSTLGDFYYDWLWNIKRQALKPSTFEKWEGIYRNYIKPHKGLNNIKLIDVDTMHLQKISNQLLKTHTVSQVKTMNSCLGNCFRYAKSINKIKYNPVEGLIYPKNHEVLEEKDNYISEEDQKDLIKALEGDKLEGIILIGLMCGLRLGEAMALQVNDIDFNNMNIKITKSVKYVWTGEKDKNGKKIYENRVTIPKTKKSIREVPLPSMLKPILRNLIKKNMELKLKYGELFLDNNLLFCKDNGDYIDNKKPNRHLKIALKNAKITTEIHYHSLRHIFITNCLSKDINPRTVMDWVGHSDIKMTMLVYAEINKDKNKKEYEKINCMFD